MYIFKNNSPEQTQRINMEGFFYKKIDIWSKYPQYVTETDISFTRKKARKSFPFSHQSCEERQNYLKMSPPSISLPLRSVTFHPPLIEGRMDSQYQSGKRFPVWCRFPVWEPSQNKKQTKRNSGLQSAVPEKRLHLVWVSECCQYKCLCHCIDSLKSITYGADFTS